MMPENSERKNKVRWYHRNYSIITAFLILGPFMLPLVWSNPSYSKRMKIWLTAAILAITVFLTVLFIKGTSTILDIYNAELGF